MISQTIHNVSPQFAPFIGRAQEIAEISDLLADPACRLLTLVGPGGMGKTRLALEVARNLHYPDGLHFVPLQGLNSHEFIVSTVAEALGIDINHCCDPEENLLAVLAEKTLLLVLDNFEHLLDGVDIISHMLAGAPGLKILVTSRETLNIQEEFVRVVAGMAYPSMQTGTRTPRSVEDYSAVQLFVQSARRARADFSLEDEIAGVVSICNLVEGMPLALELAATWVRVLSCKEIALEIQRSLDFLETRARNVEPRHRSIRAVLDHSWNLLTPGEQEAFQRLSVFRGSFTREAAGMVAGTTLPTLSALVDKSLLQHDAYGRYHQHELVRQYGERQLNVSLDDSADTRDRHSQYYLSLLERRWRDLLGERPREALQEIEAEIKNVRVAWGWAAIHQLVDELEQGVDSLGFFYDTRGWYREGEKMLGMAVEALRTTCPNTRLFGKLLAWQGVQCNSLNQFEQARALLTESQEIFRQLSADQELAFALARLGEVDAFEENWSAARQRFEEALQICLAVGDRWGSAYAMIWLGGMLDDGSIRTNYIEQSEAIFRDLGSRWGLAVAAPTRSYDALADEDYASARQWGEEGVVLCREVGIPWGEASCLEAMAYAEYGLADYTQSLRHFAQALRIAVKLQLSRYIATESFGAARTLAALGITAPALDLFAIAYRYYMGVGRRPYYLDLEGGTPPDMLPAVEERARTIDPEVAIRALLVEITPPGSYPGRGRAAHRTRAGDSGACGARDVEPGRGRGPVSVSRDGEMVPQPDLQQAGRQQPHPGGGACPRPASGGRQNQPHNLTFGRCFVRVGQVY
jgi:predicted ATPase